MNNENGIFNLFYNNINLVYGALKKVLHDSPNFEIVGEEPAVHLFHVTIGKSLFSQGDEVDIKLEQIDEAKTKIQFTSNIKVGIADNLRAKYGDLIQKLMDKTTAILPPPVMEEAPKPNNMVQVGELSRQMGTPVENLTTNSRPSEPTSLNQLVNQTPTNQEQSMYSNYMDNKQGPQETTNGQKEESNYQYEPKPFDYESLKENESSKHQGNDPLQDLMKNM